MAVKKTYGTFFERKFGMSDDDKDDKNPDAAPEAEEGEDGDGDGEDLSETEDTQKGLKAKIKANLKWIIIGGVTLLVLGGGAGLFFMGFFTAAKPYEITLALPGQPVLYTMPRITVDLTPSANRARPFIRLLLQVELQGHSAEAAFIEKEPEIMDLIQSHLRTVTVEELAGQRGTKRLRTDMIIIINRILKPERAITVLYKEILIR